MVSRSSKFRSATCLVNTVGLLRTLSQKRSPNIRRTTSSRLRTFCTALCARGPLSYDDGKSLPTAIYAEALAGTCGGFASTATCSREPMAVSMHETTRPRAAEYIAVKATRAAPRPTQTKHNLMCGGTWCTCVVHVLIYVAAFLGPGHSGQCTQSGGWSDPFLLVWRWNVK